MEWEFRPYLACGLLAYSFARPRCAACARFPGSLILQGPRHLSVLLPPAHVGDRRTLVDQVFPPLPVRQWVFAVSKRLCWFLELGQSPAINAQASHRPDQGRDIDRGTGPSLPRIRNNSWR